MRFCGSARRPGGAGCAARGAASELNRLLGFLGELEPRLCIQLTRQTLSVSNWSAPKASSDTTSDIQVVQTSCASLGSGEARLAALELAPDWSTKLSSYLEPSIELAPVPLIARHACAWFHCDRPSSGLVGEFEGERLVAELQKHSCFRLQCYLASYLPCHWCGRTPPLRK